jgi:CRP-like cAMP-binding protein
LDRLSLFEPLSTEEKKQLRAKVVRRHFKAGEQLLMQGIKAESVQFVFYGVIQVTHQLQDAREFKLGRLGPGDSFGKISLLTGAAASATFTALSSGLLLGLRSADLKLILESRPELVESLSHVVAKQQHLLTALGEAAIHRVVVEQTDLLSRIRTFFHINDRGLQVGWPNRGRKRSCAYRPPNSPTTPASSPPRRQTTFHRPSLRRDAE